MHCQLSGLAWGARCAAPLALALALASCGGALPAQPAPAALQPTSLLAPRAALPTAAAPPTERTAPTERAAITAAAQPATQRAPATPAAAPAQPTARMPPPKSQRSAAQQKIDSNLLAQIQPPFDAAAPLLVDIAAHVSDALLARMRARGAEIVAANPPSDSIRARLPAGEIEPLAGDADVIFIQLAQLPATQ